MKYAVVFMFVLFLELDVGLHAHDSDGGIISFSKTSVSAFSESWDNDGGKGSWEDIKNLNKERTWLLSKVARDICRKILSSM